MQNAHTLFRSNFQSVAEQLPQLISVSTDGYSNSFVDCSGFRKIGPDFLKLIRAHGTEHVSRQMESWLDQASEGGSGDDTTLGLMVCQSMEAMPADLRMIDFEGQASEKEGRST